MSAHIDKTDRSLTTLLSDLTREVVELVRKEVALARTEVSEKISSAEHGIVSVAIGAAVLLAGLFILLLAVVAGVAMVLPPELAPWLAPLIVGAIVALIGYGMIRGGRSRLTADNLMPERTVNSLRTDRVVVQQKVHDRPVVEERERMQ